MNKFFIATAFVMTLTGSALAHSKAVAPIPATPLVPGAVVTPQGVKVQAPPGSDVQVDVNGADVDISIVGPDRGLFGGKRGLLGLGVLGL